MKRIVKKIMSSMAVAALMIATVGCGSKTESRTENLSVAAETEDEIRNWIAGLDI